MCFQVPAVIRLIKGKKDDQEHQLASVHEILPHERANRNKESTYGFICRTCLGLIETKEYSNKKRAMLACRAQARTTRKQRQ